MILVAVGWGGNDTLTEEQATTNLSAVRAPTTSRRRRHRHFVFAAGNLRWRAASTTYFDFVGTDLIDLTGIDADTSTPGILDAFHFLANAVFDGVASALDYFFDAVRGVTVLQGDTNGDRVADFAIDLTGNVALTSTDFTPGSLRPVVSLTLIGTASADTLIGDLLDDHLYGLGGNDTLTGNAGNDYLDGGTGADTMVGAP